jgi:hypothetical protein
MVVTLISDQNRGVKCVSGFVIRTSEFALKIILCYCTLTDIVVGSLASLNLSASLPQLGRAIPISSD